MLANPVDVLKALKAAKDHFDHIRENQAEVGVVRGEFKDLLALLARHEELAERLDKGDPDMAVLLRKLEAIIATTDALVVKEGEQSFFRRALSADQVTATLAILKRQVDYAFKLTSVEVTLLGNNKANEVRTAVYAVYKQNEEMLDILHELRAATRISLSPTATQAVHLSHPTNRVTAASVSSLSPPPVADTAPASPTPPSRTTPPSPPRASSPAPSAASSSSLNLSLNSLTLSSSATSSSPLPPPSAPLKVPSSPSLSVDVFDQIGTVLYEAAVHVQRSQGDSPTWEDCGVHQLQLYRRTGPLHLTLQLYNSRLTYQPIFARHFITTSETKIRQGSDPETAIFYQDALDEITGATCAFDLSFDSADGVKEFVSVLRTFVRTFASNGAPACLVCNRLLDTSNLSRHQLAHTHCMKCKDCDNRVAWWEVGKKRQKRTAVWGGQCDGYAGPECLLCSNCAERREGHCSVCCMMLGEKPFKSTIMLVKTDPGVHLECARCLECRTSLAGDWWGSTRLKIDGETAFPIRPFCGSVCMRRWKKKNGM